VVFRYIPEVPIAVVAGHERNMKVTEPIDVYIADKLFQLTSADPLTRLTEEQ
jgi:ribitol-5-phosphate 2-dehydrogenase (NADP+) / D-ribitol-5-phosphate cytidylyltransferase